MSNMKGSKFNQGLDKNIENNISSLITSERFVKLSPDIQSMAIENVTLIKQMESGKMGRLLGTKMPNMAVYSAFLICCLLLLFSGLDMFISCYLHKEFSLELTKIIIPVITMSLGYMFGKADTPEKNVN